MTKPLTAQKNAAEVAVKFENIEKRFGSVVANSNINFEIYKGEILSLLGENGSGKTTLMNMLSGIYFPDAGKIYINIYRRKRGGYRFSQGCFPL